MFERIAVRAFLTFLVVVVGIPNAETARGATKSVWDGGDGSWTDPLRWSTTPDYPDGSQYDVYIDQDKPVTSTVELGSHVMIGKLFISRGDSLDIGDPTGASLTVTGTQIENRNMLVLDSESGVATLKLNNDVTLFGGGALVMRDSASNRILGDGRHRLKNAGNVIRGSGYIGMESHGPLAITNDYTILADNSDHDLPLIIDPNNVPGDDQPGMINNGNLWADGGGLLVLDWGEYKNHDGVIKATGANSVVTLRHNAEILGGTLETSDGGVIRSEWVGLPILEAVTIKGRIEVSNWADLCLIGTISNQGTIALLADGAQSILRLDANTTLSGGGEVTMSDKAGNQIIGKKYGKLELINLDNTIKGSGNIADESKGPLKIVNNGLIEANQDTPLKIDPLGDAESHDPGMENEGTLSARGGTLLLSDGWIDNFDGTVQAVGVAGKQSTVKLGQKLLLVGGTLKASGGGVFVSDATGNNAPKLGILTLGGPLNVPGGMDLALMGDVTGQAGAQIAINGGAGQPVDLRIDQSLTLGGTGEILMSDSNRNLITGTLDNCLTSHWTIKGSGMIGDDKLMIINEGTIEANQNTLLTIDPIGSALSASPGMQNRGYLKATGAKALMLLSGKYDNTGGWIVADKGASSVDLANDVAISGGNIRTADGGMIRCVGGGPGGPPLLSGLTIEGNVVIPQKKALVLEGTITGNDGGRSPGSTFSVGDLLGGQSELRIRGNVTLAGRGKVTLVDGSSIVADDQPSRLTIGADQRVQGSGTIGSPDLAITNDGTIISTEVDGTITLDPADDPADKQPGLINNNFLEAGDGELVFLSGHYDNSGGMIISDEADVVLGDDVLIEGGRLATITGVIASDVGWEDSAGVSIPPTLKDVTLDGKLYLSDGADVQLEGTITNDGTIELDNIVSVCEVTMRGVVELTGKGELTMADWTLNIITGQELVHQANHTILGAGEIGFDKMVLTNYGTILADQSEPLTIDPGDQPTGVANRGLLEATEDSTLVLKDGDFSNSGGRIIADGAQAVVQLGEGLTLSGGVVKGENGGQIIGAGDGADAPQLADLTLEGPLELPDGKGLRLAGTIINNGSIALQSAGAVNELKLSGAVTLTGVGTLTMSDDSHNRIAGEGAGASLILDTNQIIRGSGQLGADSLVLLNRGTILAEHSTPLVIDPAQPGADLENDGQISAQNGGTLILQDGQFNNTQGFITAHGAGSAVELGGKAVVYGGRLQTSSGGVIRSGYDGGDPPVLEDLQNNGQVQVPNGKDLALSGTITNAAKITVAGSGQSTTLRILDDVTLTGSGQTVLADDPTNSMLGDGSAKRLTIDGHHLRGAGRIGVDNGSDLALTNRGTIQADGSTSLIIDPADNPADGLPGFINDGTLKSTGSGGLQILDGTFTNFGVVEAGGGSAITFDDNTTVTNYVANGRKLVGGTWRVEAGTDDAKPNIKMPTGVYFLRNEAEVELIGAGAWFPGIDFCRVNAPGAAFRVLGGKDHTTFAQMKNEGGSVRVGTNSKLTVQGDYTQTAGVTLVDGELNTNGTFSATGGTIGGSGTINGNPVHAACTISPGESVGVLSFNQLVLGDGAMLNFEIDGPFSDLIHVTGSGAAFQLEPDATCTLNLTFLSDGPTRGEYTLFSWLGEDPFAERDGFEGITWMLGGMDAPGYIDYRPEDQSIVLTGVPEPPSVVLLLLAGLVLAALRHRRRT